MRQNLSALVDLCLGAVAAGDRLVINQAMSDAGGKPSEGKERDTHQPTAHLLARSNTAPQEVRWDALVLGPIDQVDVQVRVFVDEHSLPGQKLRPMETVGQRKAGARLLN